MACFLAPATAAIIASNIKKKTAPKYHFEWLNTMLWGGTIISIIEHLAHGEIVLYPPFLTAMQNPANIPAVLHEIATVGGAMTIAVILAWAIMVLITNKTTRFITTKNYKLEFFSLLLYGGIIMMLVDYFYGNLVNTTIALTLFTWLTTLLISKIHKLPTK